MDLSSVSSRHAEKKFGAMNLEFRALLFTNTRKARHAKL